MQTLVVGLIMVAILAPVSLQQQPTWGILNKWNTQDYPELATSSFYSCTVRWFVDNTLQAPVTATITLMDLDRSIVLDSKQYEISAVTRYDENTVLAARVPAPIPNWRLGVTLSISGPFFGDGPSASSDTYQWNVNATGVPEFSQTMFIMIVPLVLVIFLVRRRARPET